MTPERVTIETRTTYTRSLQLNAEQVENIVKRWAMKHHGFSDTVAVESEASRDGLFEGITLTETTVTFREGDDAEEVQQ